MTVNTADAYPRGPGVIVPPPLVFVAGFGLAWLLDRRLEFVIDGAGASIVQEAAGAAAIALGVGLMLAAMIAFALARTSMLLHRRARQLVSTGPYRFSRNPMYVGLTLGYLGAALVMNMAWPLLLLPFVLLVLQVLVIGREERYLRAEFGAGYDDYCRRVRRWI